MTAAGSALRDPDRALANRDSDLPGLPYLLDNSSLSALLGETVRVTRVRYKPRTSLLVAFRRTRNGTFDYGWALTNTEEGSGQLLHREQVSKSRDGNIRVLRPDPRQPGALVATGDIADDWKLRRNLLWLGKHGVERLGAGWLPPTGQLAGAVSVLRYKPERRLVLMIQNPAAPVVVKIAANTADGERQLDFQQRLYQHGVPLLPQLGDSECARHGIGASPMWGGGDLAGLDDAHAAQGARRAGEALARLHGLPVHPDAAPGDWFEDLKRQLAATRAMVSALVPELEGHARKLESGLPGALGHREERTNVPVHGDFSADQVLVGGSEVRIIDFDRAHPGSAEADLGSFAAVEEATLAAPGSVATGANGAGGAKTACLTEGYVQAGGRFRQKDLDAWAAVRLFKGSVDPFRDRSPEWAAEVSWHLRRAQELIA
jgi:thiamine kinase-like enzyme